MRPRVRLMFSLRPGKEFIGHEALKNGTRRPANNSGPSLCQFGLPDGLNTPSSFPVAEARRVAVTLALKPEVVPVNTASLVDAHFHLLSSGSETETLQRSK